MRIITIRTIETLNREEKAVSAKDNQNNAKQNYTVIRIILLFSYDSWDASSFGMFCMDLWIFPVESRFDSMVKL